MTGEERERSLHGVRYPAPVNAHRIAPTSSSLTLAGLVLLLVPAGCATRADDGWHRCRDAALQQGGTPVDRMLRRELENGLEKLTAERQTATLGDLVEPRPVDAPRLETRPRRSETMAPEDIYHQLSRGVVVVARQFKCDKCPELHLATAAGFVVSPTGAIVTAAHVLEGQPDDPIAIMTTDGRVHPIGELLAIDKKNDVAVLQAKAVGLSALSLSPDVRVGGAVHVISHPASHYYVFTSGVVARASSKHGELLITADYARGSSGAPVFDARGNVVGMVSSTRSIYYEEAHGEQKNLQMLVRPAT